MNKKLLAIAVAGALAAPGFALAQSSVTISGFFKGGYETLKYGNFGNVNTIRGATPGSNSQHGVVDDSSRIIFNVTEDLGGGLRAIGQVDMRFGLDTGALAASGNNHVGLQSRNWGRLFLGRQDLHYFGRESELTVRGSLRADSISILAFAGTGPIAIANATRTTNVVHYTTPNWAGFSAIVAYSNNATARGSDIGSTQRKGSAWNFAPVYSAAGFTVGYSYWKSKPDGAISIPAVGGTVSAAGVATAPTAAALAAGTAAAVTALAAGSDQRGDRLFGSYKWGGFKIGLAWDRSKITVGAAQSAAGATQFLGGQTATGTRLSNRTAWSIPVSYTWGPHSVHAHWSKARSDKAPILAGLDTKANMFAISYGYDLSKRTSAALTYARINNGAFASYNFFTSGGLGLGNTAPQPGEDPRMWGVTLRHAF